MCSHSFPDSMQMITREARGCFASLVYKRETEVEGGYLYNLSLAIWGIPKGVPDMESLKERSNSRAEGNLRSLHQVRKKGTLPWGLAPSLAPLAGFWSPLGPSGEGAGWRAPSPPQSCALRPRGARALPLWAGTCPFTTFGGSPDRPGIKRPQPPPTPGMLAARRATQAQGAAGILGNLQFSYSVRVTARWRHGTRRSGRSGCGAPGARPQRLRPRAAAGDAPLSPAVPPPQWALRAYADGMRGRFLACCAGRTLRSGCLRESLQVCGQGQRRFSKRGRRSPGTQQTSFQPGVWSRTPSCEVDFPKTLRAFLTCSLKVPHVCKQPFAPHQMSWAERSHFSTGPRPYCSPAPARVRPAPRDRSYLLLWRGRRIPQLCSAAAPLFWLNFVVPTGLTV